MDDTVVGLGSSSRGALTQLGKRRDAEGSGWGDSGESSSAESGLGVHVSAITDVRPSKLLRGMARSILGFPSSRSSLQNAGYAGEQFGDLDDRSGNPPEHSGNDGNDIHHSEEAGGNGGHPHTHTEVQTQTQARTQTQSEGMEDRMMKKPPEANATGGCWLSDDGAGVPEEEEEVGVGVGGSFAPAVTAVAQPERELKGERMKPEPESTARSEDRQAICFFVCTCQDGKTLVVRGTRAQTVDELHEQIRARIGIPTSEQRLLYRRCQLKGASTLQECGVDNDATLYLVSRLRSTACPDVWRMVQDMNDTVHSLKALYQPPDTKESSIPSLLRLQERLSFFQFDGGSNDHCDSVIKAGKIKMLHERVTKLFWKFLANAMMHGNSVTTLGGYVEALRVAGGATALVNLLASPSSLFEQEAARMIHCFMDENSLVMYFPECTNQIVARRFLDCSGPLLIDICNILEAKLPYHPLNQDCCNALVHWLETSTNYYDDFYVDVSAEWLADHLSPLLQKVSRTLTKAIRDITALMSGSSQDIEHPLRRTDAEWFSTFAVTISRVILDCHDGRGSWLGKLKLADLFQSEDVTDQARDLRSGSCSCGCKESGGDLCHDEQEVYASLRQATKSQFLQATQSDAAAAFHGIRGSSSRNSRENADTESVTSYHQSLDIGDEMAIKLSDKWQTKKGDSGNCVKISSFKDGAGISQKSASGYPDQGTFAQSRSCFSMCPPPRFRGSSQKSKILHEDRVNDERHMGGWLQEKEAAWLKGMLRLVDEGSGLGSGTRKQRSNGALSETAYGQERGSDQKECKMTKKPPERVGETSSRSAERLPPGCRGRTTGSGNQSQSWTTAGGGIELRWLPCLFVQLLADLDLCLDETEKFAHRLEVLQSGLPQSLDHGTRGDSIGDTMTAADRARRVGRGVSSQPQSSAGTGSSVGVPSETRSGVAEGWRLQTLTTSDVGPSTSKQSRIVHLPAAIKSVMPTILKGIHAIGGSLSAEFMRLLLIVLHRHKRVLNSFLKTSHLCLGGDLWWLLEHRHLLDFKMKREHAFSLLSCPSENQSDRHIVQVSRGPQLLEEAFNQIMHTDAENMKEGLVVQFASEEGAGVGVLREWFMLMSRDIFNQENALFLACAQDRKRFFPNSLSRINPGHLAYFRFCGRVVALALIHRVHMDVTFSMAFFKLLAGRTITWEDSRDADPELYNSCQVILDMPAALVDADVLGLTFEYCVQELGSQQVFELCPGGENIKVNSSNRQEFVDLLVNKRLVVPMLAQAQAFAKGFSDLMDNGMQLSHFLEPLELADLDLIVYGDEKDIDIDDWKAHTTYHGHISTSHVVALFWQVVSAMTPEERRRLLYFVTAIARLPSEGFAGLSSRFHIHRAYTDTNHLPTAHTCFQQLLLPMYQSFRMMHDRLHAVIGDHAVQGFGFI